MTLLLIIAFLFLAPQAEAAAFTAPPVPNSGSGWMPSQTENLGNGLSELIRGALEQLYPNLIQASGACLSILAVIFLVRLVCVISTQKNRTYGLICTVAISVLFLQNADSLISLAATTVQELSEYGKLLVPVMASAMAAQGGVSASASLYAATLTFDTLLTGLIGNILVPLNYIFLALSAGAAALGEDLLKKMADAVKGVSIWSLKTILYVFTGFISITGVVSGSTDAAALKAAKITISGAVPVVGGILSDASEAVLVSAGLARNAAGIYGILALLALVVGPFLKIGAHYLMLKAVTVLCHVFGEQNQTGLMEAFCTSMGLLLAMTGTVCILMMVSVVCFLQGVG